MAIDTQKKRSASLLVTDPLWPDNDIDTEDDRGQMLDWYPSLAPIVPPDPGDEHEAQDLGDVVKFGFRGNFRGKW